MAARLAGWAVFFALGLGVGFVLWGSRVDNLVESLNRMILEDDTLRARLAAPVAEHDDGNAVLSTLALLSSQIRMQADLINQQSHVLDKLTVGREKEMASSLDRCNEVETRLQEQLEACLFAKSRLERGASATTDAPRAAAPRRGSQIVTESREQPDAVIRELR